MAISQPVPILTINYTETQQTTTATSDNYLTFSSPNTFTLSLGNNYKMWDGTLEYSIDTTTWDTWSGSSAISSSSSGTTKYLYLRGTNNTIISGQGAEYGYGNWILTGADIRCDGNIENLLDYQTVANGQHPTMADDCFKHMFKNQSALISTPSLPAITLSDHCYSYMFTLCSNLVTIPELPATTLTNFCYYCMFSVCSKIKLSTTQTGEYIQPYRLPVSGTGIIADYALISMFEATGGTFTGTPELNTTYYVSNTNTIVPATQPEPEPTIQITPGRAFIKQFVSGDKYYLTWNTNNAYILSAKADGNDISSGYELQDGDIITFELEDNIPVLYHPYINNVVSDNNTTRTDMNIYFDYKPFSGGADN